MRIFIIYLLEESYMNKMKAAMIGFLPQDVDPYQTLETYAKIGYRAF